MPEHVEDAAAEINLSHTPERRARERSAAGVEQRERASATDARANQLEMRRQLALVKRARSFARGGLHSQGVKRHVVIVIFAIVALRCGRGGSGSSRRSGCGTHHVPVEPTRPIDSVAVGFAVSFATATRTATSSVVQPDRIEFKFFALIRLIERAVKRDAYGRFEASSATIAPDVAASAPAIGGAAAWFQRYVASSLS